MKAAPPVQISVIARTWYDKRRKTREEMILIHMGALFVRIPMSEVYNVSNQIVDLREAHDKKQRERRHP